MSESNYITPEEKARGVVNVKCARCAHQKALLTRIEGDEGIRKFQCEKCRNVWTVKMGGPIFNF